MDGGMSWGVQFSSPPVYSPQSALFTVRVSDEGTVRNYPVPQNGETFFIDETHGKAWLKTGNNTLRTFDLKETTPVPEKAVTRAEVDDLKNKMDTIISMLRQKGAANNESTDVHASNS